MMLPLDCCPVETIDLVLSAALSLPLVVYAGVLVWRGWRIWRR